MKTSVSGYPRIGRRRELKFAVEAYFNGELDEAAVREVGRTVRLESWKAQAAAGITHIPSNDFSFYDNMLDTALLFGVVPRVYREAGLSALDTLFAMARGRQAEGGPDLKARPLRKWFNTNYHYLVSEFEEDTIPVLSLSKPMDEFREALAAGIRTRPVVVGPFTFLRLAQYPAGRGAADYADALADAYAALAEALAAVGASSLQFDEPSLVTDLEADDLRLLRRVYGRILSRRALSAHLNLPYGDIRDCYREVMDLGFDGVALDFVEGTENLALLRSHGFPAGATLTAGLVNGKNVWRTDRGRVLALLGEIAEASGRSTADGTLVLGTSCSLLHVPVSLAAETKLDAAIRSRLAFAEEKLAELAALAAEAEATGGGAAAAEGGRSAARPGQAAEDAASDGRAADSAVADGAASNGRTADSAVRARVASLAEADFIRLPAREARFAVQQERFRLPALPTTTIGSFPQTAEVRELRAKLRKGTIDAAAYEARVKDLIASCIALQEDIGLDVLVHGEFERNDMVEFFGQNLAGFAFTANGWVQSYGTRCVKPPIIVGDVSRTAPLTVDLAVYAQSLSAKPVKGMLTGPVTILNWSFPREDLPLREIAFQIALAIRDEVADLERHGIGIIQIDEAALREKMPLRKADRGRDYLDWAIAAFRLTHSGVKPDTQIHTHMCYSDFTGIVREIDAMDADVITFEAARSNLEILDYLVDAGFRTAVGPGIYDIHSPRVPSEAEIEAAIRTILEKTGKSGRGYEGLWVNPDCGLKTRGAREVEASLRNLVAAAGACRR